MTIRRTLAAVCTAVSLSCTSAALAVVAVGPALATSACTNAKKTVDVVAKTGVGLAKGIGQAQEATKAASDLNLPAFPPDRALKVQQALLKANTEVGKLPEVIRLAATAEIVQGEAAKTTPARIDAWLTILKTVSRELGVAIGDLPVESIAAKALQASRQAQETATTFILELEKFKASLKQE